MNLLCRDCRRIWDYTGAKKTGHASCPDCKSSVPIEESEAELYREDVIAESKRQADTTATIEAKSKRQEGHNSLARWRVYCPVTLGINLTRIICDIGRRVASPRDISDLKTNEWHEIYHADLDLSETRRYADATLGRATATDGGRA